MMVRVYPVMEKAVRQLCTQAYPLHPKGCPNYGKRPQCPPEAEMYDAVYDLDVAVYAVINEFDLGAHVARMKDKHPDWSERQLKCVLYWQGTARKAHKALIKAALNNDAGLHYHRYVAETCPEAMGVNVTDTLSKIGIQLEWPPVHITRQVALLGRRK